MIPRLGKAWLVAGYLFLYLPIVTLIVFSFNESKMASLWTGFSLRWYVQVVHDEAILSAVWVSLKIAFFVASAAVVLGSMAAFEVVRELSE